MGKIYQAVGYEFDLKELAEKLNLEKIVNLQIVHYDKEGNEITFLEDDSEIASTAIRLEVVRTNILKKPKKKVHF